MGILLVSVSVVEWKGGGGVKRGGSYILSSPYIISTIKNRYREQNNDNKSP